MKTHSGLNEEQKIDVGTYFKISVSERKIDIRTKD
jgi:hypothetical protein